MQQALAPYGIDYFHLTGHSFRIGVALASRAGIEDSMIQTLGRWCSSAYLTVGTSVSQAKCWQPLRNDSWTVMITSILVQIKSHLFCCFHSQLVVKLILIKFFYYSFSVLMIIFIVVRIVLCLIVLA